MGSSWRSAGSMGREGRKKEHHKLPCLTVIMEFFLGFGSLFNGTVELLLCMHVVMGLAQDSLIS